MKNSACRVIVGLIGLLSAFTISSAETPSQSKKFSASPIINTTFQDVAWGSTLQATRGKLTNKFHLSLTRIGNDEYYSGSDTTDGITLRLRSQSILLQNFPLGDRKFDVVLSFTEKDELMSYSFTGDEESANYLETHVKDGAKYLTSVFQKKFGKPSGRFNPNILGIQQGYNAIFAKWTNKVADIYTAVSVDESLYYPMAEVSSKEYSAKQAAYDKAHKAESIKGAAKSF